MKVVYVSDNRVRGNYGCRATSTALSQLVRKNNEITGVVSGKYTNYLPGPIVFSEHYPHSLYSKLASLKHWNYLRKIIYLWHKVKRHGNKPFLFSKFDFVSTDLDKSIDNLIACLPANDHIEEYDLRQYDFDAMVVNGEGSFIFATPPWRESIILLMLMHWAQKMGKKVYFLNAMFSDDPYSQRNQEVLDLTNRVLSRADYVSVREYESLEYAKRYLPNVNAHLIPDALFTWYPLVNDEHIVENGRYYMGHSTECDEYYYSLDFTKPYICVSGSSAPPVTGDPKNTVRMFSKLVSALKMQLGLNVFLVDVCEGDAFLEEVGKETHCPVVALDTPLLAAAKILANARVYVTGRYHPGIMASLGGTPCVFMSSNSHKTHSLQGLLNVGEIKEFPIELTDDSINAIVLETQRKLSEGEALRMQIKKRCETLCDEVNESIGKII